MSRKNQPLLIELVETLSNFRWWVSCIAAVVVYIFMKYVISYVLSVYYIPTDKPDIHNFLDYGIYRGVADFSSMLAPIIAFALLIGAPISFIKSKRKKQLLEKQKNINTLHSLRWDEFEELVGEAFRRQGYSVKENSKKGQPDGGIDLILKQNGELTLVQCKHWKARQVGVKIVRELYGVMASEHADKGILVTSGLFTPDAKAFAANKPIEMIDGKQLLSLIGKVRKDHTISETSFDSEICPVCGSEMVLRIAKKGKNPGKQFWGCSRFPKCRGTKSYNPGRHQK